MGTVSSSQEAVNENFSFFNESVSLFGTNVPKWWFIAGGILGVVVLSFGNRHRRY